MTTYKKVYRTVAIIYVALMIVLVHVCNYNPDIIFLICFPAMFFFFQKKNANLKNDLLHLGACMAFSYIYHWQFDLISLIYVLIGGCIAFVLQLLIDRILFRNSL
jgi:hypothetical protein